MVAPNSSVIFCHWIGNTVNLYPFQYFSIHFWLSTFCFIIISYKYGVDKLTHYIISNMKYTIVKKAAWQSARTVLVHVSNDITSAIGNLQNMGAEMDSYSQDKWRPNQVIRYGHVTCARRWSRNRNRRFLPLPGLKSIKDPRGDPEPPARHTTRTRSINQSIART
jgi:hypothetical protein